MWNWLIFTDSLLFGRYLSSHFASVFFLGLSSSEVPGLFHSIAIVGQLQYTAHGSLRNWAVRSILRTAPYRLFCCCVSLTPWTLFNCPLFLLTLPNDQYNAEERRLCSALRPVSFPCSYNCLFAKTPRQTFAATSNNNVCYKLRILVVPHRSVP